MAKSALKTTRATATGARNETKVFRAFLKAADAFDAKHGKTKQAAMKQLRKEGFITRTGKPTKRYAG